MRQAKRNTEIAEQAKKAEVAANLEATKSQEVKKKDSGKRQLSLPLLARGKRKNLPVDLLFVHDSWGSMRFLVNLRITSSMGQTRRLWTRMRNGWRLCPILRTGKSLMVTRLLVVG